MAELTQTFDTKEYTFADVTIMVGGQLLTRATGVEYKITQTKTEIYGKSNTPVAIQRGQLKTSGTLNLLQSELETLTALSPGHNLLNLHLDAVVAYGNPENGDIIKTDVIHGIEFTEVGKNLKNSDSSMNVDLPFIALSVEHQVI